MPPTGERLKNTKYFLSSVVLNMISTSTVIFNKKYFQWKVLTVCSVNYRVTLGHLFLERNVITFFNTTNKFWFTFSTISKPGPGQTALKIKKKEKRKDIFQCCGRSDPLKQDQQDKLCQSIIYNIVWKKSLIYTGI